MLVRFDPFRELDRMAAEFSQPARPWQMPMDAYRRGDEFVVHLDVPGVDPNTIDLTVEQNTLTVTGERTWPRAEGDEVVIAERPQGDIQPTTVAGRQPRYGSDRSPLRPWCAHRHAPGRRAIQGPQSGNRAWRRTPGHRGDSCSLTRRAPLREEASISVSRNVTVRPATPRTRTAAVSGDGDR